MDFLFTAISIDDSEVDVDRLKKAISEVPSFNYEGNATTMAEGKELILSKHPDLLFLDIELPDANGMEIVSDLKMMVTWPMQIVFYTVYDSYELEAIRNAAFDYLLKPLRIEELEAMLTRFVTDYRMRLVDPQYEQQKKTMMDSSIFMVNTIVGYKQIKLANVVYIEHVKSSKYWRIYLSDGSSQTLRKDTSAQSILSMHKDFVQVNQSQILNLRFLGILKRDVCSLLPPFEMMQMTVSRSYLTNLQTRLLFI